MQGISPGTFEFLITGDIELNPEQFNTLLAPVAFLTRIVKKQGWTYFQADPDEFAYSFEPPGIQMVFNKECIYSKAKQIADEVVQNLIGAGFNAELTVISNTQIFKIE